MTNRFEIAAELRAMARLLTIKGDNPFKAQAYVRAASALENLSSDLDVLVKAGRLKEIAGVGNALAAIIEEIYRTGECWMLQQLRQELPRGTVELSEVPGLNLKKIIALNEALRVENIGDLKSACQQGLVSKVKGFGLKSQTKLLADIEKFGIHKEEDGSLLLHRAHEQAEKILQHLRICPELIEAEVAGALRRRKETVEEITIVAASDQPRAVLDQFLRLPALARTAELDENRCRGFLADGVRADLTVAAPDDFVAVLHERTGAPGHLEKLGSIARSKGITLLADAPSAKPPRFSSEKQVYQCLGLPYIAPELREDEGEIEAATDGTLPQPLVREDIRGMTHCHTVYSDGRNSIEEMAVAAQAMGMSYLTITDHSPSAHYAGGVGIDRLRAQWDEISRVQERVKIRLLKGTESDILEDGSLDYPDFYLEQFDIIIASIHSRHKMDSDQMTRRLLRALKLPYFKIWGHPLGRLIRSRPPFACRMEEVLDAVAASRCAIEVNGDPHRLDLEPRWIRVARERGIKFIVSTDAHSTGGLENLAYGVSMARRGWLSRDEVLNTLDAERFMMAVRP